MGRTIGYRLYICAFLVILVFVSFYRTLGNEFVYDDRPYVAENKHVQEGLTKRSVTWAFTATHAANWHPITWLSHMADCELFGLNKTGHHAVNLLLHAINSILLFLLLTRLTNQQWKSAFVAALFAIHPLRVESVAWVAERKDMLSTLFWFLTIWSYLAYVCMKDHGQGLIALTYGTMVAFFAVGLMAKPMLVTAPFTLLLLDFWPLGRVPLTRFERSGQKQSWIEMLNAYVKLVVEKTPLFVLATISAIITYRVQQSAGAMGAKEDIMPLGIRLANALTSYVMYIYKMIWPAKLAVLYPHPLKSLPVWQPITALLFLMASTYFAVQMARQRPYLTFGWFWYIGTLVPVIGIIQVGAQAMADRYTYVPLVGIFVALAWGLPDVLRLPTPMMRRNKERQQFAHLRFIRVLCGPSGAINLSAAIVVMALSICTWVQTGYWKNSITLFGRALRVTTRNYVAHNNYGAALEDAGIPEEAARHYEAALRFRPRYLDALNNMGNALRKKKRYGDAEEMYRRALEVEPLNTKARAGLAAALEAQGRADEAIVEYRKALKSDPYSAALHNDLGKALSSKGLKADAMREWRKAIELDPKCIEARYNLAIELSNQGMMGEAIKHYKYILRVRSNHVNAHLNLGAILLDQGRHAEAIQHFSDVVKLEPRHAPAHHNLAVSYFLIGNYREAWKHIRLAQKYGLTPDPRLLHDLSAKMPEPQN